MKKIVMVLSTGALALTMTGCSFFGGSDTASSSTPSTAPAAIPAPAAPATDASLKTDYAAFQGNEMAPPSAIPAPNLGGPIPTASKKTGVASKKSTASSSKKSSSAKTTASAGGKTYKVQSGDTLQKISQKFYKTPKSWKKILDANKKVLSDPKKLRAGMTLRIP